MSFSVRMYNAVSMVMFHAVCISTCEKEIKLFLKRYIDSAILNTMSCLDQLDGFTAWLDRDIGLDR